jgi:tetratricopeptide (TPR) repeat protein
MKRHAVIILAAVSFLPLAAKPADPVVTETQAAATLVDTDVDAAAKQLGRKNTAPNGTLPWYQQSAIELVRLAYLLKSQQDDAGVRQAARAAVKLLNYGHGKAAAVAPAATRAQTYVQLALVYDTLLGDHANARFCYEQALKEDPDDPVAKSGAALMAAQDQEHGGK